MHNYIIGFSVYTLAMMGIIFLGFVVVKKCTLARRGAKSHNNFLEVETSLALEPRKVLYVLRAGNERVLVATDAERTNFLTKLNDNSSSENIVYMKDYQIQNEIEDFDSEMPIAVENNATPKVFKDLLKRLQR